VQWGWFIVYIEGQSNEMAERQIHFLCNNCQTKYAAQIHQAGKEGKCKQCGATIVVPQTGNANQETKKHKKRLKSLLPLVAGIAILTILVIVWVVMSERQAVNEKRNKEIMTQKTLQRIQRDSAREHLKHILNKPFYTKHKFTIFLPLEWREIPGEILTLGSKTAQEKYDISTFSKYDYGFQLNSNIEWFDYPYILIQLEKGRVSENEYTKKLKKGLDDFKYLNILVLKTNELIYDPNSKILWILYEAKRDNKNIKGITGIILTEISTIQVHCYSLAHEYDNYLPLFEQIIKSIELSGDIRYVKQISDDYPILLILQNIDWSKVIAKVIVSVIIGIVLSAFYSYRKKVKNNSLK